MSSEYGWSDDQIMDLPLVRLRQITSSIQRRQYFRAREENGRASWLARTLAVFIAGGYMTDGKENPAMDKAQTIAFDKIEELMIGVEKQTASEAPAEPKEGSYEKLMRAFAVTKG